MKESKGQADGFAVCELERVVSKACWKRLTVGSCSCGGTSYEDILLAPAS